MTTSREFSRVEGRLIYEAISTALASDAERAQPGMTTEQYALLMELREWFDWGKPRLPMKRDDT